MRATVSALLLIVALVMSGCGSSKHASTTKAARTETSRTITSSSKGKSFNMALLSASSGAVLRVWDYDVPSGTAELDVRSAVTDGDKGWFVCGGFGLAHMRADGELDSGWGTSESRNLGLTTCDLVRSGSRLYVAGAQNRTVSGGAGSARVWVVEAFDAKTGARLWVGPNPSQDVYALAASSTRVYVGGKFTSIGTEKRQRLAALDASTGRLLNWRSPSFRFEPKTSANVEVLALAGSRLYVGGLFDAVGNEGRNSIAALDPATGALLPWNPKNLGYAAYGAFRLLVAYGQVIITGEDGFAAVSVRTGRQLDWTSRIRGLPGGYAAYGPLVYLGGGLRDGFGTVDGDGRNNLAAFNLATGKFTNWAPDLGVKYVDVGGIVPSGKQVLILGMFTDNIG